MFNSEKEPKVLLIHPTSNELVSSKNRSSLSPVYGLNILATALRQEGLETIVLDEFMMKNDPSICNPDSWIETVKNLLNLYKSIKCVGISVFTNFRKTALDLSKTIKIEYPNVLIVWGGPHVTGLGNLLFNRYKNIIDIMVAGVTDFNIILQLKDIILLKKNIKEPLFLTGNPANDISKKVFPEYSHYKQLFDIRMPKIITRTSTGCPVSNCIFCSANFLEGKYCEMESSIVQKEINRLISYNPKRIEFHDQDLCCNFDRLNEIIPLNNFSKIEECYCHADLNSLTIKLLDFFIRTEVRWDIFIGLESVSAEIRHYLGKKPFKNSIEKHLVQLNEYLARSNVRFGLFIMYGVPIEKPEHIQQTKELLKQLDNIDLSFSSLKVFPGTQLAQKLMDEGRIDNEIWFDEESPPIINAIDDEQLKRAKETWADMLSIFPFARFHNKIDQMLLNVNC